MKNRSVQILMSIGVACLATTSPLVAASYNNSFGFDFTAAADPVQPAYLDDGTEIDVSPLGDREFSADGVWMGTGGELDFTILNLPSGKYDIAVGGDGPYSGGMSFQVSCGANSYTSDYSHDGLFISDFEVTAGEPLHVVGVAGYAIAYIGGIGLYGPKMCDPPNIVTQPASQSVGMGGAVTFS